MPDLIDDANATAELHLDVALRNYKHSPIMAESQGFCLHCGVDLEHPRRWCNAEHRDLWQDTHR